MTHRDACYYLCMVVGVGGMYGAREWAAWTPFLAAALIILAIETPGEK